jgi:multidrug efflux pump subunit AcrB
MGFAKVTDLAHSNALGRLTSEKQFEDIVIKEGAKGEILRVRDVARAAHSR